MMMNQAKEMKNSTMKMKTWTKTTTTMKVPMKIEKANGDSENRNPSGKPVTMSRRTKLFLSEILILIRTRYYSQLLREYCFNLNLV